jgi:hypothetical protein
LPAPVTAATRPVSVSASSILQKSFFSERYGVRAARHVGTLPRQYPGPARSPPSATNSLPVEYDDSSEAR